MTTQETDTHQLPSWMRDYHGTIGVELAQGVVNHVRAVPEAWMQWLYADSFGEAPAGTIAPECGSAACLAGWAGSLHLGMLPKFMQTTQLGGGDFGSNYAAFLLQIEDTDRFRREVYDETTDPERAIKVFCELTGALDPGWSNDMLRKRQLAVRIGFLPMLEGQPLAAAMLRWYRLHPEGFGYTDDYYEDRISVNRLAVMISSGLSNERVNSIIRTEVSFTAQVLLGVDPEEYSLFRHECGSMEASYVLQSFANMMGLNVDGTHPAAETVSA